jgi:nicotinamide mononucleotide transporter
MILMTRKYVENWLLWVIINVISVVIFARRRLCHVAGISLLTFIALNGSRMWINSARERGSHAFSLMVVVMIVPGVHR